LPDNRYGIVSNYGDNNLTLLDLKDNTTLAAIPAGQGPGSLTSSPDGRFVYVANDTSNDVTVIDVAGRTSIASIRWA
jgi:YVTN family beta-propeller protein